MDILKQIESNSSLSKCSKETYKKVCNGLIRTATGLKGTASIKEALSKGDWKDENSALREIIKHPTKYQPIFEKNVINTKSLNLYYNTIKALIKHSRDDSLLPYKGTWDNVAQVTDIELRTHTENHVVTDRQKRGMVKWTDVLRVLETLEKGSMEHLLLMTYKSFTRRQRDYSSVRLYKDVNDTIDALKCCYIHLNPPENRNPYIHIGEGKTIKHYGIFESDIPLDLLDSINLSLKRYPRDFLFGDKSGDTFRQWCNETLRRILKNETVTVNILRHSHAEFIDSTPGIKVSERREEAKKMGHSILKQLEYNLGLVGKTKSQSTPQTSDSLSLRFKALDKKVEKCYRRDPKTNELVEGDCIFINRKTVL